MEILSNVRAPRVDCDAQQVHTNRSDGIRWCRRCPSHAHKQAVVCDRVEDTEMLRPRRRLSSGGRLEGCSRIDTIL